MVGRAPLNPMQRALAVDARGFGGGGVYLMFRHGAMGPPVCTGGMARTGSRRCQGMAPASGRCNRLTDKVANLKQNKA